ncbi:unnamed protein product, partial [Meganyctiphanes norvegica]
EVGVREPLRVAIMRELLVLGFLLSSSVYADNIIHKPLPLENEPRTLPSVPTGDQIFKALGISIPDETNTAPAQTSIPVDPVTTPAHISISDDPLTTPAQTQSRAIEEGPLTLPELPEVRINELDSQILGILNPPAESGHPLWPPYMDELWPDIML